MSNASMGKRDAAKQGHCTPRVFLDAVERRFGRIGWDLAAAPGDEVGPAGHAFTPGTDALTQSWRFFSLMNEKRPVLWLNPPFANIEPWVAKLDNECREEPRWTLCLVPYSAGANWWRDHVHEKCVVYSVGRMKFVGSKDPYPKDLALLAYGFGARGVVPKWDWRKGKQ